MIKSKLNKGQREDPRTMDIINPELQGMPQKDYFEEIKIRNHKAGYTARDGKQIPRKIGKGYGRKYSARYDTIFRKNKRGK